MQLNRQTGFGRAWNAALGGLLAVLLLGSVLAAVAHRSHQAAHPSDAAHHICLICALAAGQVDIATPVAVVAILAPILIGLRQARSFCFPQHSFHILPPGRAPPLLRPV